MARPKNPSRSGKGSRPTKARVATKATGARPAIDWDHPHVREGLAEMAKIHCTYREMAAILGVAESNLMAKLDKDANFRSFIEKNRQGGKLSLRRTQLKAAEAGSNTMMVWLGRQWLDQTERNEITQYVTGPTIITIPDNSRGPNEKKDPS